MPELPGPVDPAVQPALTALGFASRWAALLAEQPPPARPFRVVRDHRGWVVAAGEGGEARFALPPGLQAVAGDWIAANGDRMVAILERSSAVVRPRPAGEPQVLAANVDLVGLVHGLERPLNRRRLERGLILAWESGAIPLILLTKSDLSVDPDAAACQAAASGPGVDVVVVSAIDHRGLDDLRSLLQPARTLALIGASGAGKSSLANALLGTDVMATNEVRAGDGRGRHTTSHRELLMVPGGGVLLDTPGLRALTIGAVVEGLDKTFPEIEELGAGCRFRDCQHEQEPGCAVLAALESGLLDPDRFEGWCRVRREANSARLRADPVALRQRNRQWGRITREATRMKRGRDGRREPQ